MHILHAEVIDGDSILFLVFNCLSSLSVFLCTVVKAAGSSKLEVVVVVSSKGLVVRG